MDSTVAAIPIFIGTMGAEHAWLRAHADTRGATPADYERRDTITSLAMGTGSLLAPFVAPKLLGPFTPGTGRYAKALVATAVGAAAVTTVADLLARLEPADDGTARFTDDSDDAVANRRTRRRVAQAARRVAAAGGVVAIVAGGIAITTTLASSATGTRMWPRRLLPDLGQGPAAFAAAILGWDFIYYWNHRFMHESRFMWAVHVVHHSSERYNLSTALRQPVADSLGAFVPYGILTLFGIRPGLVAEARGINLLYQYWIHTDAIRRLGPFERVFNTPSHHRVHHGSNKEYLDRNHGSILIIWDRWFGTFQREEEPVIYGLTKNLDTFNPARAAGHEHFEMLRDVHESTTWRERLSYVFRGPGWAYRHRDEKEAARAERLPPQRGSGAPAKLSRSTVM
jgi:sterol desaturase/sphingolipid hydroxylase (fatty acid hydroxylase superfamily)